jgi:excisionase family DNA binding protein
MEVIHLEKEIYTVDETADYLGVQRLFVTRALKEGRLKGSKLGKIWRIQKKDILEYLESTKQEGEPENK